MAQIGGEILTGRPPEVVFDVVGDERNEPRYNPRMLRAENITPGPISAGRRFNAETKMGRRIAQLTIENTA